MSPHGEKRVMRYRTLRVSQEPGPPRKSSCPNCAGCLWEPRTAPGESNGNFALQFAFRAWGWQTFLGNSLTKLMFPLL